MTDARQRARWVLPPLLLLATFQSLYYYPRLPETLASHFDGRGVPNGWSSKTAFFAIYWGMVALALLIGLGVPRLIARLPLSMVNVPNKEYWLEGERREESLAFIGRHTAGLGAAMLTFMVSTVQLVIEANRTPGRRLSSTALWVLLGAFLAFLAGWIVRFFTRFPART